MMSPRPSRPVAPLRNPGVNPLSCRPIFNPLTGSDLGGQGEVTSQAMMTQLPSDFEVIQGPAQHPRNLTRMALPLTGTRHTCIFDSRGKFFFCDPAEEIYRCVFHLIKKQQAKQLWEQTSQTFITGEASSITPIGKAVTLFIKIHRSIMHPFARLRCQCFCLQLRN